MSAGLAGILIVGWLGSAPANLATGYELKIIAASVIGGADLAGGVGGPVGAIIGAALIEVIRNGSRCSAPTPIGSRSSWARSSSWRCWSTGSAPASPNRAARSDFRRRDMESIRRRSNKDRRGGTL